MIVGAIDIGTNTVLLLIAEQRGGELVPILDRAEITRLGEGVDRTRRLSPEAVERTLAALVKYAEEARSHGVQRLHAVGTSALRDAEGGAQFLELAEQVLGVRPRVIDGLTEAELTFRGALSGLGMHGPIAVFDVGGGSTEIIVGHVEQEPVLVDARSLDVGSVRLYERYIRHDPPSAQEMARIGEELDRVLLDAPPNNPHAPLVGVAGTVTTLAAIELGLEQYDASRVHGHKLSRDAVARLAEQLAALSVEQRRALAGLEPKRADVIVVGAEIVRRVLVWSGAREIIVSDRGVRWGLAEELLRADPSP